MRKRLRHGTRGHMKGAKNAPIVTTHSLELGTLVPRGQKRPKKKRAQVVTVAQIESRLIEVNQEWEKIKQTILSDGFKNLPLEKQAELINESKQYAKDAGYLNRKADRMSGVPPKIISTDAIATGSDSWLERK